MTDEEMKRIEEGREILDRVRAKFFGRTDLLEGANERLAELITKPLSQQLSIDTLEWIVYSMKYELEHRANGEKSTLKVAQ